MKILDTATALPSIESEDSRRQILHHYFGEHESSTSPDAVVPWLLNRFKIKSVIDVGCGLGQWLEAFERHVQGVEVLGLDGAHVPTERLRVSARSFMAVDLFRPNAVRLPKRFDLAISLEVAEHLPESAADDFVSLLTSLSDLVLFSAAIPGQTGENHVNEQWPMYWVDKFRVAGFAPLDEIRSHIWDLPGVSWWYKQNTVLYTRVRPDVPLTDRTAVRSLVHPDCFTLISEMYQSTERQRQALSLQVSRLQQERHSIRVLAKLLRAALWRRLTAIGSNQLTKQPL